MDQRRFAKIMGVFPLIFWVMDFAVDNIETIRCLATIEVNRPEDLGIVRIDAADLHVNQPYIRRYRSEDGIPLCRQETES